jgi:hypothetical protein
VPAQAISLITISETKAEVLVTTVVVVFKTVEVTILTAVEEVVEIIVEEDATVEVGGETIKLEVGNMIAAEVVAIVLAVVVTNETTWVVEVKIEEVAIAPTLVVVVKILVEVVSVDRYAVLVAK